MQIIGIKSLLELIKVDNYVAKKYEFRDFYEVFIDGKVNFAIERNESGSGSRHFVYYYIHIPKLECDINVNNSKGSSEVFNLACELFSLTEIRWKSKRK